MRTVIACILAVLALGALPAATPDMMHTGRIQALVSERTIPFSHLNYNHEGTIEVMADGRLIALWQSSTEEGAGWGWAMSSIWDGSSWSPPRPVNLNGPSNAYTPVPFQTSGGALLAYVHDGGFPSWPTNVYASFDHGLTWTGPHGVPRDPATGARDMCTFSRPLEFPDGRIIGAMIIDNQGTIKTRTSPAGNPYGPWADASGWAVADMPAGERIYLGGSTVRLSDDYQHLAHFVWKNLGGQNVYSVSSDGGKTWGPWIPSLENNHNHVIELDPEGGPLKGWYAMATADGSRKRIRIAFARGADLLAGVSSPFTVFLDLDNLQSGSAMSERVAHGIVQTPDRLLHVTGNGRHSKAVHHWVIDPDVLLDDSAVSGPGYITALGAWRTPREDAGTVTVSVQRVGGSAGACSVDYATVDGDALDGVRYRASSGTITWADGDTAAKGIEIPLIDDGIPQGTESFFVHFTNASGAPLGGLDRIEIMVHDDASGANDTTDDRGLLQFLNDEYAWFEDNGGGDAWVTWTRHLGPGGQLPHEEFTWRTRDIGSAVAGVDYVASGGTVTVVGGSRRKEQLAIPLIDNDRADGPRRFAVDITSLSGGTLGARRTAIVTILDDEGRGGGGSGGGTNGDPVAQATATPDSGTAPLTVQLDASGSTDPDDDPLSFAWTFGDGATGSGATPSHTYDAAGSYTATVTVTDGNGGSGSASVTITVGSSGSGSGRPADDPAGAVAGLRYDYYEGSWSLLPDFGTLTAVTTGTVATFDIGVRERDDQFAVRFAGYVDIPSAGTWTFATTSDDGSRLWIGDQLVVDNDGLHGSQTRSGTIDLAAGLHAITVGFFEQGGGQTLDVTWQGPGQTVQTIPAAALFHVPATAAGRTITARVDQGGATRTDVVIDISPGGAGSDSGGVYTFTGLDPATAHTLGFAGSAVAVLGPRAVGP